MDDKSPGIGTDSEIRKIFKLKRTIDRIFFKDFDKEFDLPAGLNFTHMKASLLLRFNGNCTMSELSSQLVLEKGSFTPVATRLIEKGFIEKVQSDDDRRVYNLALTKTGLEMTEKFITAHLLYVRNVICTLTHDEQKEYLKLIERLNGLNDKLNKGTRQSCEKKAL